MKSLIPVADEVYGFLDVSPNNNDTVKSYELALEEIRSDVRYKNLHIVPIICIEYFLCKFLDELNLLLCPQRYEAVIQAVVQDFDYSLVPESFKQDAYTGVSLEHLYKDILSNTVTKCLRNKFNYDKNFIRRPSISGIFYEKDCTCDRVYCRLDCDLTLRDKAELLYILLPVIGIRDDRHISVLRELGFSIRQIDHDILRNKCQDFYNKVCNSMNCMFIKVYI